MVSFLMLSSVTALAQLSDFPMDPAFIAFLGMQLLGLLAKLGVLVWAYVKTKRPAAIAYAIYLLIQSIIPFIVPMIGPEVYARYAILLAFVEIFLFIWLMYSLSKRFRIQKPLPSDDVA